MSATLHVPSRKDYLRPSKTLQDLKEKLGSVFIDAQLIECPKNAFELSRLQNRIEELDRQKYKCLSDANREQRILYNSLSTKYINDSSVSNLDDPVVVEIVDNKLLPPGFRFHSNGNPKLQYLKTDRSCNELVMGKKESKQSFLLQNDTKSSPQINNLPIDKQFPCSSMNIVPKVVIETILSSSNVCDVHISNESITTAQSTRAGLSNKSLASKKSRSMFNYESEIENLENIINQLKRDILSKRSITSTVNIPNAKHNYLRAHSRTDDEDRFNLKKLPDYFSGDTHEVGATASSNNRPKRHHYAKCLACQVKLKHPGSEINYKRLTAKHDTKARWQLAPRGTYVASPKIHASKRAKSVPSLKRYDQSEEILKTYMISGMPTRSEPRYAVSVELGSSIDNSMKNANSKLQRFPSPSELESRKSAFKSRAECEVRDANSKVENFLKKMDDDNHRQKLIENQKKYHFLKIV